MTNVDAGAVTAVGSVFAAKTDRFFELSLDMLCTAGLDGRFRSVNPAFTATLGWSQAELLACPVLAFVHPDDIAATREVLEGLGQGRDAIAFENRCRCKDGSYRWVSWTTRAMRPSDDILYAVARDVTDKKEAEAALDALARTDSLTGLANSRALKERLALGLAESRRGRHMAVVMVDVDHFKDLNDALGHRAGDQALVQVARALTSGLRDTDLVGRYGGEEFCILLSDLDDEHAVLVADKLRRRLHTISTPRAVTASFGVSPILPSDASIDEAIERADRALYRAKRAGRDRTERVAPADLPPVTQTRLSLVG